MWCSLQNPKHTSNSWLNHRTYEHINYQSTSPNNTFLYDSSMALYSIYRVHSRESFHASGCGVGQMVAVKRHPYYSKTETVSLSCKELMSLAWYPHRLQYVLLHHGGGRVPHLWCFFRLRSSWPASNKKKISSSLPFTKIVAIVFQVLEGVGTLIAILSQKHAPPETALLVKLLRVWETILSSHSKGDEGLRKVERCWVVSSTLFFVLNYSAWYACLQALKGTKQPLLSTCELTVFQKLNLSGTVGRRVMSTNSPTVLLFRSLWTWLSVRAHNTGSASSMCHFHNYARNGEDRITKCAAYIGWARNQDFLWYTTLPDSNIKSDRELENRNCV